MKKLVIVIVLLVFCVCLGIYFYAYQDRENIETSDPSITLSAIEAIKIFQDDDPNNNAELQNKIVQIAGNVTTISSTGVTLDHQVIVLLEEPVKAAAGGGLTIKGRCIGYDDLLEELKIDEAVIVY